MRKVLILLIATLTYSATSIGQDVAWTKESRNMVYNDILNDLVPYKITQEQKESIALCCLEQITGKYSKTDYQAKIDVEIKRIKSSTISQCSKNIGVELENPVEAPVVEKTEIVWSKEDKALFYNDALNFFNNYEMTKQDREVLSMCFADQITKDYSKEQLNNMIEPELKKVKADYRKKCVEEKNIKLKKIDNTITKKDIVGNWQSYDFSVWFWEDGTMEKKNDKGIIFNKDKGKWFLEPNKMIFVIDGVKEEYNITFFSGESLKLEMVNSGKILHLTRTY